MSPLTLYSSLTIRHLKPNYWRTEAQITNCPTPNLFAARCLPRLSHLYLQRFRSPVLTLTVFSWFGKKVEVNTPLA